MNEGAATAVESEVASWTGVSTGDTGRGGLKLSYGKVELGHLHGDSFADLPFPKKVRNELIEEGRASVHPPLPNSGWMRRRMNGPGDAEAVIELFRMNYDRAKARDERSKMTVTGTPQEGTNATSSGFPDGLPERSAERPRTSDKMPHEQLSLNAPPELQERLRERILAIPEVASGASGVSVPGARAFFVDHQESDAPKMMSGEFAHIHPPYDGSLHAMLPRDVAEKVVEKGWGELHPYSRGGRDSWANVLIFGPRDEAELETVYRIVRASHDYVQGNAQDAEPGNDKENMEQTT